MVIASSTSTELCGGDDDKQIFVVVTNNNGKCDNCDSSEWFGNCCSKIEVCSDNFT